jgi:hypothetical protein
MLIRTGLKGNFRLGIWCTKIATIRVKYPEYRGSPITVQNFGYGLFPPAANGWETIHPIPDKAPSLQAEEEGYQPKKN